jgi:hypothetical protein
MNWSGKRATRDEDKLAANTETENRLLHVHVGQHPYAGSPRFVDTGDKRGAFVTGQQAPQADALAIAQAFSRIYWFRFRDA